MRDLTAIVVGIASHCSAMMVFALTMRPRRAEDDSGLVHRYDAHSDVLAFLVEPVNASCLGARRRDRSSSMTLSVLAPGLVKKRITGIMSVIAAVGFLERLAPRHLLGVLSGLDDSSDRSR